MFLICFQNQNINESKIISGKRLINVINNYNVIRLVGLGLGHRHFSVTAIDLLFVTDVKLVIAVIDLFL